MTDHLADHALEAFCGTCQHLVDAVCPDCRRMVESSGAEEATTPLSASVFHRRLLAYFYSKRNAKFAIACFFIATGQAEADGLSMSQVAVNCGVTKATVSKYCREICEHFAIPPSRYMRKEENAATSRMSNWRQGKRT